MEIKDTLKNGHVQSINRAFSIIEALKEQRELSVSELGSALDLDRSTVHRILATLRALGYVNQNPENLKYRNSLKFFDVGYSAVRSLGLNQTAEPFMERLADKTGEAVNLAVMESYSVVYIKKIESQSTIRVNLPLGAYMPAYCTGLGKMLLSYLPEEEIHSVFKNSSETVSGAGPHDNLSLCRWTSNTITDVDTLCQILKKIRQQGFSIDDGEYLDGLYCIAVPVFDYRGSVVAAMSVALPKIVGIDTCQKAQDSLRELLSTAKDLSAALGYRK